MRLLVSVRNRRPARSFVGRPPPQARYRAGRRGCGSPPVTALPVGYSLFGLDEPPGVTIIVGSMLVPRIAPQSRFPTAIIGLLCVVLQT
jgi:hypothetical protein